MTITAFLRRLGRADLAFYILPLLMLYIVLGTLAQRPLGLYAAQKYFFSGAIVWLGPLPLPGFYIFTAALTISLLCKFIFSSDWIFKKSGIHLAHLGVLVLLAGGLLTALTAREGYMAIAEGQSSPYVYDYIKRNLYIFENDTLTQTLPFHDLENKKFTPTPFPLTILETCENCTIEKRTDVNKTYEGMARFMALKSAIPEKEPEKNMSGATFTLEGKTYLAFEGMPKPIEYKNYKIMLGREQRSLPFSVKLNDFTKQSYPGTSKARAYMSDIEIDDNGIRWPAHIEMNKPLRYKGYTFYQSSFEQSDKGEISILSVVENKGRAYPYIGTALIAAGLILHLIIATRKSDA